MSQSLYLVQYSFVLETVFELFAVIASACGHLLCLNKIEQILSRDLICVLTNRDAINIMQIPPMTI